MLLSFVMFVEINLWKSQECKSAKPVLILKDAWAMGLRPPNFDHEQPIWENEEYQSVKPILGFEFQVNFPGKMVGSSTYPLGNEKLARALRFRGRMMPLFFCDPIQPGADPGIPS